MRDEPPKVNSREAAWAAAMRAGLGGDDAAYGALLREIATVMRGFVRRRLSAYGLGAEEAEDVVQEVLIGLHEKRATWDAARPFLPWLNAIARHKTLDAMRRLRRQAAHHVPVAIEDWAEFIPAPETDPDRGLADLDRHVATLPRREREVVTTIGIHGLSIGATAQRYAMSEGAVRVAFHRGLARLGRTLGKKDDS